MSRPLRLLAVLALGVALATATAVAATTAQPTRPATTEDPTDRRLSSLIEEAQRNRTVVELFRSGERNFVPDPDILGDVAARPHVRPVPDRPIPAVPRPGVGMIATLLLGLVGGVIGGMAVLASWAAATHRHPRQPASAT